MAWNPRLRTSGGRFLAPRAGRRDPAGARIEINPRYAAAGGPDVLADVMKHELAHYHLWASGRPWGHTPEFRALMKSRGFARHVRADLVPRRPARWQYTCPACGRVYARTRRYPHPASCSACSPRYDARFRLLENRIR